MKVAIFVFDQESLHIVSKLCREEQYRDFQAKLIAIEDSVREAEDAYAQGARVVIARGMQAQLIKEHTSIHLVESRISTQDLGFLIRTVKKIINKPHPHIGLVGFANMFYDTSHLGKLFDVKISRYFTDNLDDYPKLIETALNDNIDIVLGGKHVLSEAALKNLPSLFLSSGEGTYREAFEIARKLLLSIKNEQKAQALIDALFDSSSNGIIQVNAAGQILKVNRRAASILRQDVPDLLHQYLPDRIAGLDRTQFQQSISHPQTKYAASVKLFQTRYHLSLNPILAENRAEGAVIILQLEKSASQDFPQGDPAAYLGVGPADPELSKFQFRSEAMQQVKQVALRLSRSASPKSIYSEVGTDAEILAQFIHQSGPFRKGPYVRLNLSDYPGMQHSDLLFGRSPHISGKDEQGILAQANKGTLLLQNIPDLNADLQRRLLSALTNQIYIDNGSRAHSLDIQLIALFEQTGSGPSGTDSSLLIPELYYYLNRLALKVPPLRERPEDLQFLIAQTLDHYAEIYACVRRLQPAAEKMLLAYAWPGNLVQLNGLIEYLVLNSRSRTLSKDDVLDVFRTYHQDISVTPGPGIDSTQDPELDILRSALAANQGKRKETAEFLNISTATLWRRMKKYNLLD